MLSAVTGLPTWLLLLPVLVLSNVVIENVGTERGELAPVRIDEGPWG